MEAVEYILKNVDALKILNHYDFKHIADRGDSYRACCKVHNGDNPTAFVWNKSNNLWYCYTGECGGGDVFTLIQKIEEVDFITSVKIAANILGLSIDNMEIIKERDKIQEENNRWVAYMKGLQNKDTLKEYILPHTTYYDAEYRQFPKDTLSKFGIKYVKILPLEESILYNRLIIPIYFKGALVGITTRALNPNDIKWVHQPKGLKISNLLYNYDNALAYIEEKKLNELILVEGILDVLAYYEIGVHNVVAIFGSNISKRQMELLLQTGMTLVLSFDNDTAGNKCKNILLSEYKYKADFKTITLYEGFDPCDMTSVDLLNAYMNRK